MATQPEMGFEAALSRLEEVVRLLEGGETTLEETLALFEEGVRLAGLCTRKLNAAEGKIERLLATAEGGFVREPFVPGGAGAEKPGDGEP